MLSLNKIFNKLVRGKNGQHPQQGREPLIIPRSEHTISRKQISQHALKVLYTLKEGGYDAYLVGGCVRDLTTLSLFFCVFRKRGAKYAPKRYSGGMGARA